jgi:hypothetical protein
MNITKITINCRFSHHLSVWPAKNEPTKVAVFKVLPMAATSKLTAWETPEGTGKCRKEKLEK